MPTNLALDDRLIEEALKIGHHKTKREAVTVALVTYIKFLKQKDILNIFGKIPFDKDYDYKKNRARKNPR